MKTKGLPLIILALILIFAGCSKEMTDEEILDRAEEINTVQENDSTSSLPQEDNSINFTKALYLNDKMDLLNGIDEKYYNFIDNISGIVISKEENPDFIQITIYCEDLSNDELYDLAFNNLSDVIGSEGEPIGTGVIGIADIDDMDSGQGSFLTYGVYPDDLPEFKIPSDYYAMLDNELPQMSNEDFIDMIAVGFNDEFPELTFLISYFGADMDTYIEYLDGFSSFDNYNYNEEEFTAIANTPSGYSITSKIEGAMLLTFLSQNPMQNGSDDNNDVNNNNDNDNNYQSDPSAWEEYEVDNTPLYFDDEFGDLQGIDLDEFIAGFGKESYDFLSEYVTSACIFMPQPPIDEPENDDEWIFYEFCLDGISLEDAKEIIETNRGITFDEGNFYKYEKGGFGINYENDFDGNTILKYITITKSEYLPNVKKLDDYNKIIDIPLPTSDDAYLQGLMLNYNVAAKDVEVMYEYALLNGKSEEVIENYIDTVSQIEGGINSNNVLSSVVRNGVFLRVYFDNQRYSDMDMLRIEVAPLPISVFTCGFEEKFNKKLEIEPIPKIVTDIFDIAKKSFTDCDVEMNYTGDNMTFTIHSDTYNGNLFHKEVFEYLEMEGEPEGDNGGFWYNFEDYRVSAYINGKYIRVDITGSTDDLLDYGKSVYTDYPYHLMPELHDDMYDINISYPVFVNYNFDNQAFSYIQSNDFPIYFDFNGIIDESEAVDYLKCAYPARYEEMSELSIKGVPASYNIEYWDNNENITHVEIFFDNHNILGRYDD